MRALALGLCLVAAMGCDTDPLVGGEDLSRRQVEAARADFVAAGVASYRLRYAIQCFCPPNEVEVHVVDGRVVAADGSGDAVEPLTVLGLYDVVLDAFRQDAASVVARVTASHPRVPTEIWIDYDARIADEEVGYRVLSFEASERPR